LFFFRKIKKESSPQVQPKLIINLNGKTSAGKGSGTGRRATEYESKNYIFEARVEENGVWSCPYCETFNNANVAKCVACGKEVKVK